MAGATFHKLLFRRDWPFFNPFDLSNRTACTCANARWCKRRLLMPNRAVPLDDDKAVYAPEVIGP